MLKAYLSVLSLLTTLPCSAFAQDIYATRGQGYLFFAPGVGNIGSGSANVHIGGGGEAFIYKVLGMGAEIGPVIPLSKPECGCVGRLYSAVGLGTANVSYHHWQSADRKLEPFVTAGYSLFFRAGLSHGFNAGAGANLWFSRKAALRLEVRDHHSWRRDSLSFRIGATFR
jgi:hypothetical protein